MTVIKLRTVGYCPPFWRKISASTWKIPVEFNLPRIELPSISLLMESRMLVSLILCCTLYCTIWPRVVQNFKNWVRGWWEKLEWDFGLVLPPLLLYPLGSPITLEIRYSWWCDWKFALSELPHVSQLVHSPHGSTVLLPQRICEGDANFISENVPIVTSRMSPEFASQQNSKWQQVRVERCGRTGYTEPTGRTGPRHDPPDPSVYSILTSLHTAS